MLPVGIEETLCRALAKLTMRPDGDKAKTAYGNLQLCVGLEASIEGSTPAVGHMMFERVKARRHEGGEAGDSDEEEESGGVSACLKY